MTYEALFKDQKLQLHATLLKITLPALKMPVNSAKAAWHFFILKAKCLFPTNFSGSPNYLPSLYSLPIMRAKEDRTENFKQPNILCKIYLINASMAKFNLFKCLYHMATLPRYQEKSYDFQN